MIYLQLSTGQAPAECQYFARFALRQMLREAEAAGLDAEILSETPSKHGLMSAVVAVSGSLQTDFAQRWLGTRCNGSAPARSAPTMRAKTGLSPCRACPTSPRCPKRAKCALKPAVQEEKAGSTSIKPKARCAPCTWPRAYRCAWKANAASTPTKNARWNSWR